MEKIIANLEISANHRLPITLVQKILHYAMPYNNHFKNLCEDLAIKVSVSETIKKLDIHYYNLTFSSLEKSVVATYIKKLQQCKCCKAHISENNNPHFCPVKLVRQNACVGIPNHICNCSCAFYIKEFIFQHY